MSMPRSGSVIVTSDVPVLQDATLELGQMYPVPECHVFIEERAACNSQHEKPDIKTCYQNRAVQFVRAGAVESQQQRSQEEKRSANVALSVRHGHPLNLDLSL
jgi:hypothetical protein